MEQQARVDLLALQPVPEDVVPVAAVFLTPVQIDQGLVGLLVPDLHLVRNTGDVLYGQPRVQLDLHIKGRGRGLTLVEIGAGHPAVAGRGTRFWLVGVPRPHHRGIHELVHPFTRDQQLGVPELHLDEIPGQDIGDVHLEHIGPLLLQQGGAPTLFPGLLIFLPGGLPLPHPGHDPALADGHL